MASEHRLLGFSASWWVGLRLDDRDGLSRGLVVVEFCVGQWV